MRTRMLAAVSLVLAACAGSETPTTLSITPSGAQMVSGPVTITASPASLANDVTWSLSGPGTISGTKGISVVYRPPVPPDPSPATVTASALGQTATVTFTAQPPPALPSRAIAGLTGNVDVTYDQYDIPHIFCASENDCYAVQGYIQAQDRLFQMDLFRRIARGRLSSLIGSSGVSQDTQILTVFITRDLQRIEDVLVTNLDATTKAKIQAFTNGVNAYIAFLKANPTLIPGEYAQVPGPATPNDIPDWELQDTLAIGRLQQFQLSETIEKETAYGLFALTFGPGGAHADTARFNAYANNVQQPVKAYTLSDTDPTAPVRAGRAVAQPLAAPDLSGLASALGHVNAQMREFHEVFGSMRSGAGSNNWVVDGAHSDTGHAMVANDPHLSLQYPPLFHLSAMTASDGSGLNVVGGAFAGIPGALIGRGAHVGWGVTVVGYDVTDLYQETLTNCVNPPPIVCGTVQFPGGDRAIAVKPYAITVKGAAAVNTAVLVVPHHGPIVHYDPATQTAISMRWTGHEGNTQDLKAFLDLNNASAVGDDTAAAGTAFAALKNYAVGAQNFVLADDQGNIGYDPHALVPLRGWVISAGLPPWFPLPGKTGTAEWGGASTGDIHCAANPAPADCWVPDALLPRGVNPAKGYFATANSDPAGYTDDGSPIGNLAGGTLYPYLSFDWSDPTAVRYGRIAQLLKGKTTTGTQKVSLADMQSIQSDHVMLLAKLFADRGFYPPTTGAPADYATGRSALDAWASAGYDCPTGLSTSDPKGPAVTDATVLTQSAGCLLFHTFFQTLLHNVFDDDFAVVSTTTAQSFGGDTGAEIRALFSMLASPGTHSFCDDVTKTFTVVTPGGSKTCEQQVIAALTAAVATLRTAYGTDTKNWLWGRVHTLTATSQLAPLIAGGFSAGPFARPGGALTVDVGNPSGTQSSPLAFAYGSGSNVRFISVMDPAPANAQVKMQLPGPERDAPALFTNSLSLIQMYVQNQYFDLPYGHQVDSKGVSTQRFTGP